MPTGIPNNALTLAIGKQTAKGTPQLTPTYKVRYTGGFGPTETPQTISLAETDASALATGTVRVGFQVEGTAEHYVRPDEFGLIAYLAMGANADSGSSPNYTHTATHSLSAPYATLFKAFNSTSLVDRYADCRIGSLTVNGAAGAALTASAAWGGTTALLGATDPVLTPSSISPMVYPEVTCTIGGSAPGTVTSFTITINNSANFYIGDSGLTPVDYILGRKLVTGSMTFMFQNDQDWREFITGSTSGTAPSATIVAKTLNITALRNANLSIAFDMTNIRYSNYSIAFGTDGAPAAATVDFESQNLGTVAQYLSVVTKNQVASY